MAHFFKNITIPLLALFSALLLWSYVVLEKQYETTLTLPIRLTNVPERIAPAEHFPPQAQVLVSGRGKELILLIFTKAELLINCEDVQRGTHTFTLNSKNVEISVQTEVNILIVKSPPEMTILFDAIIHKELPVLPDFNVSLSNNVTLVGEPVLVPRTAVVSGPRCNVALIGHLEIQPVQMLQLRQDTSFFAFIQRPDYYGLEVTPNKVRVSIKVAPIKKREITDIPIKLIGLPPEVRARLDVKTVSLVVAGAEEDVNAMRKELINVYVSYSRFSIEQQVDVEPTVSIIGNVEWSNLSPKTVRLVKE